MKGQNESDEMMRNFSDETRKVLRKSEQGLDVTWFDSVEALFKDLGI